MQLLIPLSDNKTTQNTILQKLSGALGTECLNTRFTLLALQHAGHSMKLCI